MLYLIVAALTAFATLGAWVAIQKNRGGCEGLMLGFLFGPLGVLIEALLPTLTPTQQTHTRTRQSFQGDEDRVEYIVGRYEVNLSAIDPRWRSLPFHRKRSLCVELDREIAKALQLPRGEYADCAAEARRRLLGS